MVGFPSLMAEIVFQCKYHISFLHSLVDTGYFHVLVIVSKCCSILGSADDLQYAVFLSFGYVWIFRPMWNGCSDRCGDGISLWVWFASPWLYIEYLFMYLSTLGKCLMFLCPFLIRFFFIFGFFWVLWVLYVFWMLTLYEICDLPTFSPIS